MPFPSSTVTQHLPELNVLTLEPERLRGDVPADSGAAFIEGKIVYCRQSMILFRLQCVKNHFIAQGCLQLSDFTFSAGSGETDSREALSTLSDGAFERIQDALITGQIAPGTRISEQFLSQRFGIGRGPVREAIRRLEGHRLVVRVPHAGVRVASLSFAELIELYHVREALEGMACRLAATHMSADDIAGLYEVLATHEQHQARDSNQSYYQQEGDLDIHYCIVRGCKNKMLDDLLCGDLYHLLRMYRYRYSAAPRNPQQALADHRRIIDAIADRDAELAELLMRRHISASRRNIEQHLQSGGDADALTGEAS